MPTGYCPDCDGEINMSNSFKEGSLLTCSNCGAYLKVIGLSPTELDWAYDDSYAEDEAEYAYDD
jgi:lysine biosynthesis protein LysW